MWTGMDETRGVKGKDGDEARRKHRSGCKSPVIFPSKKTLSGKQWGMTKEFKHNM